MGLFNGLRATWGQFYFHAVLSRAHASQGPAAVDPKAAVAEPPRRAERALGAREIMGVDIARVRSGIATKLTPSSLFGKILSTWCPSFKNFAMTMTLASIPGSLKSSREQPTF